MPLYEYRCQVCDRGFEALQRMGASADGLVCPACGSPRVTRQFSTFAAACGPAGAGAGASCAPGGRFT